MSPVFELEPALAGPGSIRPSLASMGSTAAVGAAIPAGAMDPASVLVWRWLAALFGIPRWPADIHSIPTRFMATPILVLVTRTLASGTRFIATAIRSTVTATRSTDIGVLCRCSAMLLIGSLTTSTAMVRLRATLIPSTDLSIELIHVQSVSVQPLRLQLIPMPVMPRRRSPFGDFARM